MSELIWIQFVGNQSLDDLLSLQRFINDEAELRGSAEVQQPRAESGTLGGVVEILAVTLGPGGAAAVLASVLTAWIRQQRSKISLRIARPDGTQIDLDAEQIRTADSEQLCELVNDAAKALSDSK